MIENCLKYQLGKWLGFAPHEVFHATYPSQVKIQGQMMFFIKEYFRVQIKKTCRIG